MADRLKWHPPAPPIAGDAAQTAIRQALEAGFIAVAERDGAIGYVLTEAGRGRLKAERAAHD